MAPFLAICNNISPNVKMPIDLPIVLSIGLLLMVTLPWHAFLFIFPPAVNNIALSKDIFGFNFGSNVGNCLYLTIVSAFVHLLNLHWRVVIVFMIYWFFKPLMLAKLLKVANTYTLHTTYRLPSDHEIWLRYSQLDFLLIGHYIIYAIYYAMFGHHGVIMCFYYLHVFIQPYQILGVNTMGSVLMTAGSLTIYIIGTFITNQYLKNKYLTNH
jgi:hypothetical protein